MFSIIKTATLVAVLATGNGQNSSNFQCTEKANDKKSTITEILAPYTKHSKTACYHRTDPVVYYGCTDEVTELSKNIVDDVRQYSHQNKPLHTLCSSDEALTIKWVMRRSLMTRNGDNGQSSCFEDVYFEDRNEHAMSVGKLLEALDTCKKENPINYVAYSNYKYNEYLVGHAAPSDIRDPQAKRDFDMNRANR